MNTLDNKLTELNKIYDYITNCEKEESDPARKQYYKGKLDGLAIAINMIREELSREYYLSNDYEKINVSTPITFKKRYKK